MSIDTSGLFGWPSPAAIESACSSIEGAGDTYLDAVEDAGDTWQQLGAHYSGEGETEILGVFGTVMPNARLVADTAQHVRKVLTGFAQGIRMLEIERTQVTAQIAAADTEANEMGTCLAAPASSTSSVENLLLQGRVSSLAGRYRQLEDQTAAELSEAADGGGWLVNSATSVGGTITAGTASVVLDSYTSRRVQVWDPRAVYVRYPDPETRLAHMARGRWTLETWRTQKVNGWDFRPQVSRDLYNQSERYRSRVDADRSGWAPKADKFSDLTASAKGVRVGGSLLAVGTAALTIRDERQDAYNEILQANPAITADELENRANLVGGVKGATKAGIDLGAAAAGAALGTVIGGPAGTIVGAGIGMGVSIVTSVEFDALGGRSIKDAIADSAMDLVDGLLDSEIGSAAVEGAKEFWNGLWG